MEYLKEEYHHVHDEVQGLRVRCPLSAPLEDSQEYFDMLDRSECAYLHRAIDSWDQPPDFSYVQESVSRVQGVYGMFIAEAINVTARYYFPIEARYFDFEAMCGEGTVGSFGPGTCIPSLGTEEYRKYALFIAEEAIDLGVQDILFGQVYLQDTHLNETQRMLDLIRGYACSTGKTVLIGGQTNSIRDEAYLRNFDYVTGGLGLLPDGGIESANCSSQYSGFCWALLWHDQWRSRVNNVLIVLDWAAYEDEIHRFARLERLERAEVLNEAHTILSGMGVGFIMPFRVLLNDGSHNTTGAIDNCYGYNEWMYSPSSSYTHVHGCRDEHAINSILSTGSLPSYKECDTDYDGCVSNTELFFYIERWKASIDVPLSRLAEAIDAWKRECA